MPDQANPDLRLARRKGRYWMLPYLLVLAFGLAALVLVWSLERQQAAARHAAMVRDLAWVGQSVGLHLQANEEFLGRLGRDLEGGRLDVDAFSNRAGQFLADNGELLELAWMGAGAGPRWNVTRAGGEGVAGPDGALPASCRQGVAASAGPGRYALLPGDTRRAPRLEYALPVRAQQRLAGCVVAVYGMDRLLRHLLPGWLPERYRIAVLGADGSEYAASAPPQAATGNDYTVALDPPTGGLRLRASALAMPGLLPPAFAVLLIAVLAACSLWSLALFAARAAHRVRVRRERDQLFRLSPDLLCITDPEGVFVRGNPAFERILGVDPARLPGSSLFDLLHPDDTGAALLQFRTLAQGGTAGFEGRFRTATGAYRWLQWNASPLPGENLVFAVAHDVTERRAAEEALRSETSFRKAMEESVLTGLRAIDCAGRITHVNQAFCRMVGYSQQELVGATDPFPYWPPEDLDYCRQAMAATLAGEAPRSGFEMRIRRRDGECIDTRFYVSPLVDTEGVQHGWMAAVTDITEPKRVRAELELAHERFETVLDGLDAAVFVADAQTDEILFANRAFESIHGRDAVGRSLHGLAVPQPERGDYRVDPRRLTAAELPRELFDGELQHPLSGRWYHVREQATRWVDGRVVRMGIATDITDRKHTEVVARQQEERLQQTARLITMGEMASTLAHELNQPLAAIANYSMGCVTRLESDSWQAGDLLVAMRKTALQAERAGKIIRRIRDFVKKSEPRRSTVHLGEVLEDTLSFAEIDARRVGVQLVNALPADLPPVFADRIMIEQVLLNLVRNGIEAMADALPAERELRVKARLTEDGRNIEVAVVDRGHGIGEEDRERLFTAFYTTKSEGMGMGLNICRSIIEFHEGRLWVEDNPEGGSIFLFTLPTEVDRGSHD